MIRFVDIPASCPVIAPAKPAKLARAKAALAETKPSRETKPLNKGGRPVKYHVKPWAAAGVSKASYYRDLKAKA